MSLRLLNSFIRSHLRQVGFISDVGESSIETVHELDERIHAVLEEDDESDDGDCALDASTQSQSYPSLLSSAPSSAAESVPEVTASNAVVRCIVYSGLAPQMARICRISEDDVSPGMKVKRQKGKGRKSEVKEKICIFQSDGREIFIDRSSLTHRLISALMGDRYNGLKEAFLTFHKRMAKSSSTISASSENSESKIYVDDCTLISPIAILLFSSAGSITLSKTRKKVEIYGWVRFHISELHAVLLKRLQSEVWTLLRLRVEEPHRDIRPRQALLLRVVETLLFS